MIDRISEWLQAMQMKVVVAQQAPHAVAKIARVWHNRAVTRDANNVRDQRSKPCSKGRPHGISGEVV